ncbi:Uncharacterised protein [Serratia quinivorans]|nr:Uncharacterised protein [Serratia quinivorans]
MDIVFFITIIPELTFMFSLKTLLKQSDMCFFEIGCDSQRRTASYMLTLN